ncbi:MAG: Fe-S protein assembly co-chaperone HscB [Gammaproteobacteria bacterium]|nr:Fe-S protein assembly co-chaperone HscB [Gammaproteobacteria bacterium]
MNTALQQDHFALFGLTATFDLDTGDLYRRYRDLQRTLHPDRFAGASPQERRLSVQMAAQLNEAYSVLSQPLTRARYLLECRNHPPQSNPKDLDIGFLQEQILLREEWEDVRRAGDQTAIAEFQLDLKRRIEAEEAEFSRLASTVGGADADLELARQAFYRMQFYHRQLEDCQAWQPAAN